MKKTRYLVMDFFVIYSWAIMMIIVMVGVIMYFGVFNSKFVSQRDYNSRKLAQRCEDFCNNKNMSCIHFNGISFPQINTSLNQFRCQKVIKNPIFDYYVN